MDFKAGDRVHYAPTNENGIVKALDPKVDPLNVGEQRYIVVYHCNNNWKGYNLYPGISTKGTNLKTGWIPGHTRTD